MSENKSSNEIKEIYLHEYCRLLSSRHKKMLSDRLKRKTGLSYIYQLASGTNRPTDQLVRDVLVKFSEEFPIDGYMVVTEASMNAGFKEIMANKNKS